MEALINNSGSKCEGRGEARRPGAPRAKWQVSSSLRSSPCVTRLSEWSAPCHACSDTERQLGPVVAMLGNNVDTVPVLHELLRGFAGKQH